MVYWSRVMVFLWASSYRTEEINREIWIETLIVNQFDL